MSVIDNTLKFDLNPVGTSQQINQTTGVNTTIWPYYQQYSIPYYYGYYSPPIAWVSIDKAENGFIVKKDGKTFVCAKAEEIVELLKD